jgi:hypothetical protein
MKPVQKESPYFKYRNEARPDHCVLIQKNIFKPRLKLFSEIEEKEDFQNLNEIIQFRKSIQK